MKQVNLESLAEKLNHKYSTDKIQELDSLVTIYDREPARHDGSLTTGTAASDVYISKWPFYKSMEFLCDRSVPDTATSTLKHVAP